MRGRLRKASSLQGLANVCSSYDIVGDIAIMRLSEPSMDSRKVGEAILAVHKNVRTVLVQTGAVCGDFRLRELKYVAGENKTVTVHREFGCLFSVDVERCYFSPRLSFERRRIARQVGNGEVVVNMFAGVGCFSILVAKCSDAERVYSIDVNPEAVRYIRENVRVNRVYGRVVPVFGDAKDVVEKKLCRVADRVLMPLPEKAFQYLPTALLALKKSRGWIHYYDFEYAKRYEDASEKVKVQVAGKLESLGVSFEVPFGRVVRTTGPNWHQVVLDIEVAF